MTRLQPYGRLTTFLLSELIGQRCLYLVCQDYARASSEVEPYQKPVLLTAYPNFDEALLHYNTLEEKGDTRLSLIDLSKSGNIDDLTKLCTGEDGEIGFLAHVSDLEGANRHLQVFYRSCIHAWITREKERWDVSEYHNPEYTLEILMGEPVVKIKYGDRYAIATLEELERL